MFNPNDKNKTNKDAETVIGPSVKVKGDFYGQGDIIVEGIFEGSLKTSNSLYIGDKAKIKANVEAKDGRIGGEVNGNVKLTGNLEVAGGAKINGDIEASSLSVTRGAVINGKITMSGGGQTTAEAKESKV